MDGCGRKKFGFDAARGGSISCISGRRGTIYQVYFALVFRVGIAFSVFGVDIWWRFT